jgi:cellulose biosynthesis protein BcsQ
LSINYLDRQHIAGDQPMSKTKVLVDEIVDRSQAILADGEVVARSQTFKSYAVSNFRGGIGKSTLSFNLAYEVALQHRTLLLDTCSQRNFSQNLLGDDIYDVDKTIYDVLVRQIANTASVDPEELLIPVRGSCSAFRLAKPSFIIPGSTSLYLFPSLLYSTLAQYQQLQGDLGQEASRRVVNSIKNIIVDVSDVAKADKILIDTSPFFGGATHLSWAAVDALIIPVRVDQHSIEALRQTLEMLSDPKLDFHRLNDQAGIEHQPIVHAVVMTHCGWNRQKANNPDSSTRYFVEKAVEVAQDFSDYFSESDVADCFYLLDDFHSSGRISGKERIPLTRLQSGKKYVVEGQRLEVNPSVDRYKKEIKKLALDL